MNRTLAGIGAAVGLAALAAGCGEKTDVSAVSSDFVVLTKPTGCEKVKDIRKNQWGPSAGEKEYQVFCVQDGGEVLYSRISNDAEWTSITVK